MDESQKPSGSDNAWTLTLFGTAVGAGILFLPLNAGAGGFWPLVIGTLLVFPMTFLAHRALARFVVSGDDPETDITELSREKFGEGKGLLVTALYALCFLPILPIYGVAVTNSVSSLLENQLGWTGVPRWLLSLVLAGLLMSVVVASQKVMLWVAQVVVYPLIVMLAIATAMLVPDWSFEGATEWPGLGSLLMSVWLMIPVLVFAFNHAAAVSSFFGHYLGASEGLIGLTRAVADREQRISDRTMKMAAAVVIFAITWGAAIVNPGILTTIESLSGPVMAMLIFLLPMYAVATVPALARYGVSWQNWFLVLIGLLAVGGVLFGFVR